MRCDAATDTVQSSTRNNLQSDKIFCDFQNSMAQIRQHYLARMAFRGSYRMAVQQNWVFCCIR